MDGVNKTSLQHLIREQEEQKAIAEQLSYYRGQEPASEQQIGEILAWLAANYDRKTMDFWKGLKEIIIDEKWSYERLKYAAKKLMYNVKFHTWTIAEFMEMDRTIDCWTSAEAEFLPINREYVMANFGDKWRICLKADAERLGLEYKPWITNAQMKKKNIN